MAKVKVAAPKRKQGTVKVRIDVEERTFYSRIIDMPKDVFYALGDRLDLHDPAVENEIYESYIRPIDDWVDAMDQEVSHFDIYKPKKK